MIPLPAPLFRIGSKLKNTDADITKDLRPVISALRAAALVAGG